MDYIAEVDVLQTEADALQKEADGLNAAAKELAEQAEAMVKMAWDKRSQIRKLRLETADAKVRSADDAQFYATDEELEWSERPYILPFGREYAKWSPFDVDEHPFGRDWLTGMMGIVVLRTDEARSRPTRIIFSSSSGVPHKSDKIGQEFLARHDQTGAKLGVYRIVGLVLYSPNGSVARTIGDVGGGSKLSLNTYK